MLRIRPVRNMKKIIYSFIAIIIGSFLLGSCNKNKEIEPGKAENSFNTLEETLTTLSGVVVDENNVPLNGVKVFAHGQVYITGANGFFIFDNLAIPDNRYILKFSKDGYFSVTRSDVIQSNTKPVQTKVSMLPINTTATTDTVSFPASQGGNLTIGTILDFTFPPDVYMYESGLPYNGRVFIAAAYMDPTDVNYGIRTHGGDQKGYYEGNSDEYILRAFVGTNIMLMDNNGQKLQLNPNMPEDVEFRLEIPAALQPLCPNEIDIWTFNDNFGLRGTTTTNSTVASKEGVTVSGRVGHFSYVSCEIAYNVEATVMGYVRNTNGDPIPGVTVKVGESFAVTDANGFYSRNVIAGVPITVGIFPDYLGQIIPPVNTTPYGNTTIDITVTAEQLFYGTLVDCSGNPVPGNVVITWGTPESVSTYTTTGSYVVEIPAGTPNVDIHAYGNGTEVYMSFLDATVPQEIILCPPIPTNQNSVSLSGGDSAYAVLATVFDVLKQSYVFGGTETVIELSNSTLAFYVYAPLMTTGTYTFTTGGTIPAGISYDIYQPQPPWQPMFQNATVTITTFGAVGELIEGTFSGLTSDGTQVDVVFSVPRGPDQ